MNEALTIVACVIKVFWRTLIRLIVEKMQVW